MRHVGDDLDLLRDIVNLFLESAPQLLKEIRDAVAVADGERVELAAHALRGAARNFFTAGVEDAALVLETMGRSRDLAHAKSACGVLATELDKLRSLLLSMLHGGKT